MAQRVDIRFDDGRLTGYGEVTVEKGRMSMDPDGVVLERGDLLYLRLERGTLKRYRAEGCPFDTDGDGDCGRRFCPFCGDIIMRPGDYVVCRAGLYQRVDLEQRAREFLRAT